MRAHGVFSRNIKAKYFHLRLPGDEKVTKGRKNIGHHEELDMNTGDLNYGKDLKL